jgi:NIPSNAP
MASRFTSIVALVIIALTLGAAAQKNGRSSRAGAGDPPAAATEKGQRSGAAQATPPCGPNLTIKNVDKQSRCFELRTYTVREGSSIDLLHSRFRDHSTALFQKHGMTVIGYWQPVAKPDTLVYMLAYKDAAARDASWAAFQADPEWVKVRTEMQVNVQVDNMFMSSTDYSPMK